MPEAVQYHGLEPQSKQIVDDVLDSGQPVTIAKDGRPAAVVVGAAEYEAQQRRLALLTRIARGERDFEQGRVHTQEEVDRLLDEWLIGGD